MALLQRKTLTERTWRLLRVFTICTVIELLLAPLFAYVLHQLSYIVFNMGNMKRFRLDINYFTAWNQALKNQGVKIWFVLIQALYAYAMIYLYIKPHARPEDVKTIRITDKISIPVPVGNGQHGSARFATENEKERIYRTFIFSGKETCPDGGLVVEMKKVNGKERILYVAGGLHSLIIGSTGSGKTRRVLLETIWLQIMGGKSLIISDVKGEICYYTREYAISQGYKTIILDLRRPKKSAHYNYLQPVLDALELNDKADAIDKTWDLVAVLVGEQKGEPLWYNGETATIAAGILAVCMEAPETCKNLANVYYFLAYMGRQHPETGLTPLSLYLDTLADNHPAKTVFLQGQIAAERTRSSFYTSALGTLKLFTNPNVAEMTSISDFKLSDIGSEKTVVYMMIPDEKKTLYPLGSIFVNQSYMANVELAGNHGGRLPVPIDYDLDEVGNFPTIPVLPNIATAGRSRGVRMNLVIQDYQQLQAKYKDDFKTIKGNCRVKLYLKSDSTETLEDISKTLDKYTVEVTSASSSASYSKHNDGSVSVSSNMTGRNLLQLSELTLVDAPYALVMNQGNYPAITELPDLSQYRVNTLWGLGDEDHNNKIIQMREDAREERDIGDIELWGIWNQYKEMLEEAAEGAKEQISFL